MGVICATQQVLCESERKLTYKIEINPNYSLQPQRESNGKKSMCTRRQLKFITSPFSELERKSQGNYLYSPNVC